MIEPRAWCVAYDDTRMGRIHSNPTMYRLEAEAIIQEAASDLTLVSLTTVADVLAALRQPSEAMLKAGSHQGSQRYYSDAEVKNIFLDMLDAFEKEQSSPAKMAYEAANPLGGPARMFDAIAERIRAGEEYHSVLADYGVTVEEK